MSEPQPGPEASENALPHEFDHTHSNVSGGWLRAATFGAMDGLVTNTSLIAGVGGAGVDAHTVILSGVAGLVAGAFSMALGEFASVFTANEQIEAEVKVETRSQAHYPEAEQAELVETFTAMGMSEATAATAAAEVHDYSAHAVNIHLTHELGVNPSEKPSPLLAAGSSFLMFCVGAIIPLIPYLLGFESLVAGLTVGGIGLLIVGALAASFTAKSKVRGAIRQLAFGAIAVAATYLVGALIGVGIPG